VVAVHRGGVDNVHLGVGSVVQGVDIDVRGVDSVVGGVRSIDQVVHGILKERKGGKAVSGVAPLRAHEREVPSS
jgi:hypothetical protein